MYHYGYFAHAKLITNGRFNINNNFSSIILLLYKTSKKMSFEELHVIDGMIYCHEVDKYVTIEEYTEYYYGVH